MKLAHFSTSDVPPQARKSFMQEVYGAVARLDVTPLDDDIPLSGSSTMLGLSGLTLAKTDIGPCKAGRAKDRVADGDDDIVLCLTLGGTMTWQWRDDRELAAGQAYLGSNDIAGFRVFPQPTTIMDMVIPRKLMEPIVSDAAISPRQFYATPEIRLLSSYAQALVKEAEHLSSAAAALAAMHVRDLVALSLGATGDAAEIARQRGVRAARLQAIKEDVEAHLLDPDLSTNWIAGRHGISARYLRALFADRQMTFADFVTDRRLLLAWRQLVNPSKLRDSISTIAYECGFNDLSWFNRAFRRRFDMTPSQARGLIFERSAKHHW